MYTEMVNFRPQILKAVSKLKRGSLGVNIAKYKNMDVGQLMPIL